MAPSNIRHSPSTSLSTDLSFESPTPNCSSRKGSNRTGSTSRITTAGRCVMKKVRKRKSRAIAKPDIKEVLADPLNFRDMVHQFTGQRALEVPPTNSCPSVLGSSSAGADDLLSGALAQSAAVDRMSACLLQNGSSQDVLMIRDEIEKSSILQEKRRENVLQLLESYDGPVGSTVLNLLSALPANMLSPELESKTGIKQQDKAGLLACLLLKQILSSFIHQFHKKF